jgi:hypothetical protein
LIEQRFRRAQHVLVDAIGVKKDVGEMISPVPPRDSQGGAGGDAGGISSVEESFRACDDAAADNRDAYPHSVLATVSYVCIPCW